jgi:hypothetical protein
MKKIFIVSSLSFLIACGNQSAENDPSDLDRTKNNDTSAVIQDSLTPVQKDTADTTHF